MIQSSDFLTNRLTITSLALTAFLSCCNPANRAGAKTIVVPKDFGTIQAAVDAATRGDLVLVRPGTYPGRIELKEGVTLRSEGDDTKGKTGLARAEATILDGKGAGEGPGVLMAPSSNLDGFTVTGIGQYDAPRWEKHFETAGEEQDHQHIGAPGAAGIQIPGVACTVTNNIVHHIGYTGIAISGPKTKEKSKSSTTAATRLARVTHNTCYRNMGGGIGSMNGAQAWIANNVCYENFYAGIGHHRASPTVVDNTCYGNIRAGIGISEGACPLVRNNRCYKNRRAGIGIRDHETAPVVENNACFENNMAGIGNEEHASPTIRNNTCYRNELAGIGSRHAAHPIIIGNECYENRKAGIGQESDSVTTLINNHCHDNHEAGIGFAECERGRSSVIGNRVVNNAKVAIGVHKGWTVAISKNELARKGGLPPIVMVFEGANAILTDNQIRGSGVAGVRLGGTALLKGNRLQGESIRKGGPPNFGVWALAGSSLTLIDNEITNWRHAVHATSSHVVVESNRIGAFHQKAIVVQDPLDHFRICKNIAVGLEGTKADIVALKAGKATGTLSDNQIVKSLQDK